MAPIKREVRIWTNGTGQFARLRLERTQRVNCSLPGLFALFLLNTRDTEGERGGGGRELPEPTPP